MVTADEVKQAMVANNITSVDHHDCSFCGYMTRYVRDGDSLFFDPGCDCTGGKSLERRDFQDPADWINMQSNHVVRAKLAEKFGVMIRKDEA